MHSIHTSSSLASCCDWQRFGLRSCVCFCLCLWRYHNSHTKYRFVLYVWQLLAVPKTLNDEYSAKHMFRVSARFFSGHISTIHNRIAVERNATIRFGYTCKRIHGLNAFMFTLLPNPKWKVAGYFFCLSFTGLAANRRG